MRKSLEIDDRLRDSISPLLEQQDKFQRIVDAVDIPKIEVPTTALNIIDNSALTVPQDNNTAMSALAGNSRAMQLFSGIGSTIEAIQSSSIVHAMGELAMKSAMPSYQFESPALQTLEIAGKGVVNLVTGLNALMKNPVLEQINEISSNVGKWLQTVDFSPLTRILGNIQDIGFGYDYEEVNEVFLKAMFDARWFPYAGWIADFRIVDEMLAILDTSRASKNRIKRIDNLIFSYYDKDEINNLKRGWRQMKLPSYMTRILVQSVQAYHRREYALIVSALSTLWEGIIQEKVNDTSYRISRKTRENLTKLIEENEFDKIFSSFCEEFIFYDCRKAEEVKPDVPGRHGIAHCWYDTYPNRKMALNAILFTDFLLGLKPLEKTEDNGNGQIEDAHAE